jgi:hypothetical protein
VKLPIQAAAVGRAVLPGPGQRVPATGIGPLTCRCLQADLIGITDPKNPKAILALDCQTKRWRECLDSCFYFLF